MCCEGGQVADEVRDAVEEVVNCPTSVFQSLMAAWTSDWTGRMTSARPRLETLAASDTAIDVAARTTREAMLKMAIVSYVLSTI
jgi:hypothetical protein